MGDNVIDNNGRRRSGGPMFESQSSSVHFWTHNPLTNLFRKSGKRKDKEGAEEHDRRKGGDRRLRPKEHRSSSCDAPNHGRLSLSTRFTVDDGTERSAAGSSQRERTKDRGASTRKKKNADQPHHQQQAQHDLGFSRTSALSSSYSSLLHQRIFLSSRGASPLVPFFHQSKTKADTFRQSGDCFGSKAQRRSSRSQHSIPRVVDHPAGINPLPPDRQLLNELPRRDHSLDSGGGKVAGCVRRVPIIRLPPPSHSHPSPSVLGSTVSHQQLLHERREEFMRRKDDQSRKMSWEERSAELEEWMQTQPIALRRLEQHERIRRMMTDERDAIQKKTFTKWVNQHLLTRNANKVDNLFVDLRDGFNLIALLEALTGENLLRENGHTRFHQIQNVQRSLDVLRRRNIKLVNIRPEDIVEGNPKLTLGLIWTIILNFQVSVITQRPFRSSEFVLSATSTPAQFPQASDDTISPGSQTSIPGSVRQQDNPTLSARDALLAWARHVTSGYPDLVSINNFTGSWKDGMAFCALLHNYRPGLVNWDLIGQQNPQERLRHAFDELEKEFGVAKLLDPEDVCEVDSPDERSLITYISQLHNRLVDEPKGNLDDLLSRLTRDIRVTNEKLDSVLTRIDNVEAAAERGERVEVLERQVRELVEDLHALKQPIDELFLDVDILRQHRHPDTGDFNQQVIGLEQRRTAYLGRLEEGLMRRLGISTGTRVSTERYTIGTSAARGNAFRRVEEAIQWIRDRLHKLNTMQFSETLEVLEQMFEQHKLDNRDIQDFRQTVDECIARQAEVSAEDSYDYCELLKVLESEYQQLRDLSAGRMIDLDSLIAFIRAAQLELVWIHNREDIEVTRNWSDLERLDIPMLQNYFKQLLHEVELHEKQFNDVHNQGAALINQRHPAGDVIEVYLRTMQNQWDWLLNLSKCLEGHLRDAYNAKAFVEESDQVEQQMQQQLDHLDHAYNRTDFSLDEGEQMLRQLDSVREHIQQLHARLLSLTDRCAQISPLWQRGERITKPLLITAMCEYKGKEIHIRQGDECTLLNNSDPIQWRVLPMGGGVEATVPSVVFRIPPPDPRLASFLSRLHGQFEKLRKLWDRKHHLVRYNMVLNTMRTVRGWDLDTFLSIPADQRDEIIKALNEDVNKLLSELDPNDPLAKRLKDELRLTNEHFYDLLARAQKAPEPDFSNQFDGACAELVRKFEEGWKQLNHRVHERVASNLEQLERQIHEHKAFEDALQTLDVDVSNVKELYRQLPHPTPAQRAAHDNMVQRWEDIWELSRMYVERLKALEAVLNGLDEVTDIVRRHEITLASFDDLPAALERLRGVHAQLLELNMVLQQQENIVKRLNKDTATLRQHVARTRFGAANHPDVDQIEDRVSQITVRWDNVNSQVAERLRIAEEAQQTQMVYRSQYNEELGWLDRVESTINNLRRPEELRPEELQGQLDQLVAEYAQLQEHTATIENINKEGGKFIRDAKSYDIRLGQYHDSVVNIHGPGVKSEIRRQVPQPKTGAVVVTEELELLNRRFAELSSVILERKNIVNVLIQNWRRKQQESLHAECVRRNAQLNTLLAELAQVQKAQEEQVKAQQLDTAEDTRMARDNIMKMRNQLRSQAQRVEQSVAEADRLCTEGVHALSPEQFHALRESRQRVHATFESLLRQSDSVLARLDGVAALLLEFSSRASAFQSWLFERGHEMDALRALSGDAIKLEHNRKTFRELGEQISSKRSELSTIVHLAQQIETEINAYVDELSRRNETPVPGLRRHQCTETARRVQDDFEALLSAKQELSQLLRRVANCSMQYEQRVGEVGGWLAELERAVSHAILSASEDTEVRLANLVRLNHNAVEGQSKIEAVDTAAKLLDEATAQTDAHQKLKAEHEAQLAQIRQRFGILRDRIKGGLEGARAEITRREGLAQGIRAMAEWLESQERRLARPNVIPLGGDKLSELKYEDQLERGELEGRAKVMAELGQLMDTGRSPEDMGGTGQQLAQQFSALSDRFRRVTAMARSQSDNLRDAVDAFDRWHNGERTVAERVAELNEAVGQLSPMDAEGAEKLGEQLKALEAGEWPELQGLMGRLAQIPNVEQPGRMVDKMRSLEVQLARTRRALGSKLDSGQRVGEGRRRFREKAEHIGAILTEMESRVQGQGSRFAEGCRDVATRQSYRKECEELRGRLGEIGRELEELEQLGSEVVQSGGHDGEKRRSMEAEGGGRVPEGPLAGMTRQLFELHRRKGELERTLTELLGRMAQREAESRRWSEDSKSLVACLAAERTRLDKAWRALGLEPTSLSAQRTEAREGQQRMRQQQHRLAQLRLRLDQLADTELERAVEEVEGAWDGLERDWASMAKCAQTAETLWAEGRRLDRWLDTKGRLAQQCQVPSVEVKLVEAQLGIVKMLQSELADEQPRWERFNDDASEVVRLAESESFRGKTVDRVDELNRRWRQFEQSLTHRLGAMTEARQRVETFDALQRELRQKIRRSEMELNDVAGDGLRSGEAEQRRRLAEQEVVLEKELRPALEELQAEGKRMEEMDGVVGGTFRSEVEERLEGMARAVEELGTKMDSVRRAAESESAADQGLQCELGSLLDWIRQQQNALDLSPIATDQSRLNTQIDQFCPVYARILAREGEVIILGSKATALLAKTPAAQLKKRLLELNELWPTLLSAAKDRQERLEKVRRALEELVKAEQEGKAQLANLDKELEDTKAHSDFASPSLSMALDSLQQRLLSLGPSVENVFALMDKLERALNGHSGVELKKHRMALEQLRGDYTALVAECNAAVEQARGKDALRARFNSEAEMLRSLLDTTRDTTLRSADQCLGKDALRLALAEFDSRWKKGFSRLQSTLDRLRSVTDQKGLESLEAKGGELEKEAKTLREGISKRMEQLERIEVQLEGLLERSRKCANDVSELGEAIVSLHPIGRDQSVLKEQRKECERIGREVEEQRDRLAKLEERWTEDAGGMGTDTAQAKVARADLERAGRLIERHRTELAQRARLIGDTEQRMDRMDSELDSLLAAIGQLASLPVLCQPLGTDINTLKAQREALKTMKEGEMAELAERRERSEAERRELIRGAGAGVSTDKLECQLRSLNSAWHSLSYDAVGHRERQLDASIQALGSFREAEQSLLNWLEDTEQLIGDQNPPSTDHKVVRAQLQNQAFQFKLVEDKKQTVEGFVDLVQKLVAMTDDKSQHDQLRMAGEHIASRYAELLEGLGLRHQQFQEILMLSEEWAQLRQHLAQFLDNSERQLHTFEQIPTDVQRLEGQKQMLEELKEQTEAHREQFDRAAELAEQLEQMASLEEGQETDREVRRLAGRYDALATRLEQLGQLMGTLAEEIAQFLQSTQQLFDWLNTAELAMRNFDDPSTEPEELGEQSDGLANLVSEIADQSHLVAHVVEISRELCAHASGSEAVSLQLRTDQLRQRYAKLSEEAAAKIELLEKALPLTEDLKEGMEELGEHLDGVEEDLQNLDQVCMEEQFQLVSTIESELGPARDQLDALQALSAELQRLVADTRANQLARDGAELSRRFNAVADTVSRKADQLRQAERQSRHTFDVLDFWIDWFNDVQEQIVQADKPAVDMEMLRQQLRQQHALNQEVVAERNGLRELVGEATKVARELSGTLGGQEAVLAKVDRAKRLADETAELGAERVAELEQAFALCKELDSDYTELNEWMDGMEQRLHACEPITVGMPAKELLAQQQHNNSLLQQIQSQRPMVAKFERNVAALSELCSEADEQNLKQISENVVERFDELSTAFHERGEALSSSIEQCSQLTDRLNLFLSNLSNALDQLRAQDPASCRPPILRRQIADNGAIVDLLLQKEQTFRTLKEQAQEALAQKEQQQQGTTVVEMGQRLEELDQRWMELHNGAEYRRTQLDSLLPIVDQFWLKLSRAQHSIEAIRQSADTLGREEQEGPGTQGLEEQLQRRQHQLQELQSALGECGAIVQQSTRDGLELCARLDADEERNFVQQHLAMLQSQWETLLAQHAQLSGNLNLAMDQALHFHALLQQFGEFLAEKETQIEDAKLGEKHPPQSVEDIQDQLQLLEGLGRELDGWGQNREQLNQMGAELCAQPSTQPQAPSIRLALSELNHRWNRLHSQLSLAQQQLERSLLDMGQFAHAHGQLMIWLAKTESMLSGVDTRPGIGLKRIEIEQCKLRMILNDIGVHQSSFEAIQATGRQMIGQEQQSDGTTQQMLDEMAERWRSVGEQAERLWVELERSRAEASSRSGDLDKWAIWLKDLLTELRTNRPVGGLPETAMAQLDEFRVIMADVEQRRPQMEEYLRQLEEHLDTAEAERTPGTRPVRDQWTVGQHQKLTADWELVQNKLAERDKRLRKALEEALELACGMQTVQDWLQGAEEHMSMVPAMSKLMEPVEEQLAQHRTFNAEVQVKSEQTKELNNRGIRIQLSCEKKDAIPMKNRLVSLKHRTDKLQQRSAERLRALTQALNEAQLFFGTRQQLMAWVDEQKRWMEERQAERAGTGERIRELLGEHRTFAEGIRRRTQDYEYAWQRGRALEEHAPPMEKARLEQAREELREHWEQLAKMVLKRQRSLEEALIQSGKFEEVLTELLGWLGAELDPLEKQLEADRYFGDVDTLHILMKEHQDLAEQAEQRKDNVEKVRERSEKILEARTGDPRELAELKEKLDKLNDQWARLDKGIEKQEQSLMDALKRAVDLSELMHELGSSLQDIEARLRRPVPGWDEKSVLAEQSRLDHLHSELVAKAPELERVLELARELQRKAHPRGEGPMEELIRGVQSRWEMLEQLIGERAEKLKRRLEEIRVHDSKLADLTSFVEEKQGQLELMSKCKDEGMLSRLGTLMDEQQMFKADLQHRQSELDELLKAENKRHSMMREQSRDWSEENREGGDEKTDTKQSTRRESQQQQVSPLKRNAGGGQMRVKGMSTSLSSPSPSLAAEKKRQLRKSETLAEQWRHLWADLLQYEERLKQRKATLEELERLKMFAFGDWRERYLAWNDHGKARVSDLFRRIDKSGTGMVPRKLFIDGILASRFPTTELEMGKVADEFDKGDGMISAREFMNALRFDPKKMRRHEPKTETERIHEEIARETSRCTCAHRFPIQHISSDKNRVQYGFGFGGSMKRMVRILRSTVMVRVGGGWEALDGFLAKHDPCRAKGRINVDLLPLVPDQHSRPIGAIDRMEEFATRRKESSGSSAASSAREAERLLGYVPGQPGPIMKIREKTERSMAMFGKPVGSAGEGGGGQRRGSDHSSIIDEVYGSSRIPRPSANPELVSTPSSSRPGSRTSDFGASGNSESSRIPGPRTQQSLKGVRFAVGAGDGSGRNTTSNTGGAEPDQP